MWLVIIWDALRLPGRALWRIGSLIFFRSSCLRLSPLEVARPAFAGDILVIERYAPIAWPHISPVFSQRARPQARLGLRL
jgi:hypothetical protein